MEFMEGLKDATRAWRWPIPGARPLVDNLERKKLKSHYNLDLQNIAVNGQLLPIDPAVFATSSNRGTIVDSGTTLAYLVEEAYDPFVNANFYFMGGDKIKGNLRHINWSKFSKSPLNSIYV
ncbi:hypothetical protein CsSME_00038168 [Camellia sinensis var. sinensis]